MLKSDAPEPIVLRTRRDATLAAQALEKLAIRIESFAEEIASNGYNAGYAARKAQPDVIVHQSLPALHGSV